MTLQLAVLASGNGTNFQAIQTSIERGSLDAQIRLVVSNRPGAGVIDRAAKMGIRCEVVDHRAFADRETYDAEVVRLIQASGSDMVVLAGYMRMLSSVFLNAFPGRVVNIHPALLPAFPGTHGIEDAQEWGVRITGCTVHLVDEIMDHGSVIIQAAVVSEIGESSEALAARIHAQEHRIYPQALQWLAEGRLHPEGRGLKLTPATRPLAATTPNVLISPPLEEGF